MMKKWLWKNENKKTRKRENNEKVNSELLKTFTHLIVA